MARASSGSGTMPGSNVVRVVCSKARAEPVTNTTASSDSRVITPIAVPIASPSVASAEVLWQMRTIIRRS